MNDTQANKGWCVLIVPLWNWNNHQLKKTQHKVCFNRTFMELKQQINSNHSKGAPGFNRTFMELKQATGKGLFTATKRFNRTFMELKPYKGFR